MNQDNTPQEEGYPKRATIRLTFRNQREEEGFKAGVAFLMELGELFPTAGETGIRSYSLSIELDDNGDVHPVLDRPVLDQ